MTTDDARVALVTASGRGIGRATARRLALQGVRVVVNDVDERRLEQAAAELADDGLHVVPVVADLMDDDAAAGLVAEVEQRFGRLDILVNNVGGAPPGASWALLTDSSMADLRAFVELNLMSHVACTRAALPGMVERGWGRVVCCNSISSRFGQRAGVGYAMAKAALTGFVASVAKEVGHHGIAVNEVVIGNAPHPTRTPDRQALLDTWAHAGRVGDLDEFAAAIAFLCSDDASYLSGASVPVDGGTLRFNLL